MDTPKKFFDIRAGEWQATLSMFTFWFSAITVFQILRPLKAGLFIEYLGAKTELLAKLLNIVVAAVAMVVFTFLYNRLGGRRLVYFLCLFFVACLLFFAATVSDRPTNFINWSFYLFGDLWSTVWVATFWALLNELSTPDQSKRLYGVIGTGGVLGGLLGVTLVRSLIKEYSAPPLILMCALLTLVIGAVVWQVNRLARQPGAALTYRPRPVRGDAGRSNAALEGGKLVFTSQYLLAVVGIMLLYELCSQIMDFQFKSLTQSGITGGTNTQFFLANVYLITNIISVVVQLVFTSFIMRRFGLGTALLVLPVAVALSSGMFLAAPTLVFASLLTISDNSFNYSINQTARETLYVPTSSDEQYKARAFTNMFVQRAGKGIGIGIAFLLSAVSVDVLRWLSPVTIAITGIWIWIAIFAGRRFQQLVLEREESETPKVA